MLTVKKGIHIQGGPVDYWRDLCKSNNCYDSSIDVALFGPAVRTSLWVGMFDHLLQTNSCNFKIFFCGPTRPEFKLPSGIVYVYSDMCAAACAEIARRLALSCGADYLMDIHDDLDSSPNLLDSLIGRIQNDEKEVIVVPGFKPRLNSSPLLWTQQKHFAGLHYIMMKCSTSIKMGGVDKRFVGAYWGHDQMLRLESTGEVEFRVCPEAFVAEDEKKQRIQVPGKRRLSSRHTKVDRALHLSLWQNTGRPTNPQYEVPLKRIDEVQHFSDEELHFTIEANE